MRVTLIYPPNRNIPAAPYGALPLLAGCLGREGHTVGIVDANLEVFEKMLLEENVRATQWHFDKGWEEVRSKSEVTAGDMQKLQALANIGIIPFDRLAQGERAGEILRDPELFRDPEKVTWAYDTIMSILRLMYVMNPQFYGHKPGFNDELFDYLETAPETPVSYLSETHVLPKVLAQEPDLVGVCIPFNEQLTEAFRLMAQLKAVRPNLKIVAGGAIVSAYHEELCADPRFYRYADFAMPGEADLSFPAFATALEEGSDLAAVPNLWWRDEAQEIHRPCRFDLPNLNEIAHPDFSKIEVDRYYLPEPLATYQTSRGCYYGKCTFCSFDIKQNFRFRKAELVIEDILKIQEQGGVRHFTFWDPLTPPRLMKAISRWNRERPKDEQIFWGAETKFEKIFTDQKFTDLLYEGGARFMQFGFESGSQRVLDLMVKGNDLDRVHLMLGAMKRSNIAVSVQWFIGFPGETEEEALASYRYLDEHRDAVLVSSYMGTFTLSPDDDIFRSNGDLYEVDIKQLEDGRYDFRYRQGEVEHYDRSELNSAYLARGDAESVTRMAFFLYLTQQPERAREVTNFERMGPLPERFEDIASIAPNKPESNFVATYDFDMFTPSDKQGLDDVPKPIPKAVSHAVYVTQSQNLHRLTDDQLRLVELADGRRTSLEILEAFGRDDEASRDLLFRLVRHGILVVRELVRAVAASTA